MQGELHLNFSNKEYESLSITEKDCNSDFYINLNINKNSSFETIKEKIEKLLKKEINKTKECIKLVNNDFEYIDLLDIHFFDPDQTEREYNKLLTLQKTNIIKNIDYISFDGISIDDFFKYINNIPELKYKNIILPGTFNVKNNYDEIFDKFKNNNNIFIKLDGNNEYISLKEFKKTKNKIDDIVNDINSMNLSEFEKLIYIYDIVRDREYNAESKGEKNTESRDLTKVLFGDKIVCVGFATLFKTICRKLNIPCEEYNLDSNIRKIGHTRNICYIKDKKYNIDGIYFFDPTFDCRKEDNSFLQSYRFFAKTKKFFTNKKRYDTEDIEDEENILNHLDGLCKNGIFYLIYNKGLVNENLLTTINKFLSLNNHENVSYVDLSYIEKINQIKKIIKPSLDKLDKPILNSTFIKALYEVRKKQYYKNPEKYKLSYDELLIIALHSNFTLSLTNEEELLKELFNFELNEAMIILREMQKFKSEDEIEKEIAQINLTKTLRNTLDNQRNY